MAYGALHRYLKCGFLLCIIFHCVCSLVDLYESFAVRCIIVDSCLSFGSWKLSHICNNGFSFNA